jgi:hypothetical protein
MQQSERACLIKASSFIDLALINIYRMVSIYKISFLILNFQ